jgi:hypothetical protein
MCYEWLVTRSFLEGWLLPLSFIVLSCAGGSSKEPVAPRGDEVTVEIGSAPDVVAPALPFETFAPEPKPTWPKQHYGDDAVLSPSPPMCKVVNSWGPARCFAATDPEEALLDVLRLPESGRQRLPDRTVVHEPLSGLALGMIRDEQLRHLEACDWPAHFVLLLRTELFRECGAELANVESGATTRLPADVQAVLHALSFASRVERFARAAEASEGPIDEKRAQHYAELELKPWFERSVEWLRAQRGVPNEFAKGSYAQALVSWALAEAWVRLLHAPRVLGTTATRELLSAHKQRVGFFASLKAVVDPARAEAQDTLQRGLAALSHQGVVRAPGGQHWVERAVSLLTQRRPEAVAFFRVHPPRLALAETPGSRHALFERLPSALAARLLNDGDLTDRSMLASLSTQGLGPEVRRRLAEQDSVAAHWALAQLRLRVGLLSHEREQFEWAHSHLQRLVQLAGAASVNADVTALLALTDSLRNGPQHADAWPTGVGLPFVTNGLVALPASVPEFDRNLAVVNHFELTWAGGATFEALRGADQAVNPVREALAASPYGCALEDSRFDKGLQGPMASGPEARCADLRAEAEFNPPGRPLFTRCGPLGWQDQRAMETPMPLEAYCEGGRPQSAR